MGIIKTEGTLARIEIPVVKARRYAYLFCAECIHFARQSIDKVNKNVNVESKSATLPAAIGYVVMAIKKADNKPTHRPKKRFAIRNTKPTVKALNTADTMREVKSENPKVRKTNPCSAW